MVGAAVRYAKLFKVNARWGWASPYDVLRNRRMTKEACKTSVIMREVDPATEKFRLNPRPDKDDDNSQKIAGRLAATDSFSRFPWSGESVLLKKYDLRRRVEPVDDR